MATYDSLFKLIDADHNGTLSIDEVTAFCEVLPNAPPPAVVARLFAQADVDKSGAIDEMEFSALCEGIKMLVNLSEPEIVEAYAVSEIKRLFTYLCTANGKAMRRDELRKALDILTDALQVPCADSAVNNALREFNEIEYDFETFRRIVLRLCPGRALCNIASVFVEEETRRKEKLSKTRSLFENKRGAKQAELDLRRRGGGNGGSSGAGGGDPTEPCQSCEALRAQLNAVNDVFTEIEALRGQLAERESEMQTFAMREVEQQASVRKMTAQLAAVEAEAKALREDVQRRADEAAAQDARLKGLQRAVAEAEVAKLQSKDAADVMKRLQDENAQLRDELDQAQQRNSRRGEEVDEARAAAETLQRRLREKDVEIERLQSFMSDMQVKEEESIRMEKLMREMRHRCSEREEEAARVTMRADAALAKCAAREKELEAREDKANQKYRALRRYEDELHEEWDGVVERARKEQEEMADKLAVRELELVQREAELKVREQLVDANIRKAEQTSLPERERRLRLLQQIERELCERERKLRQAEASYLQALIHPELEALRNERDDLQQRLWATKSELQEQSLRHKQEIEKLVMDHNRRLNAQMQGRASTTPTVRKGRTRSSTLTAVMSNFGSPEASAGDASSSIIEAASPSNGSPRFDL